MSYRCRVGPHWAEDRELMVKNRSRPNGLDTMCLEHERLRYGNDPEAYRARARRYKSLHRNKQQARNAVTHAVGRGEMPHVSTLHCAVPGCILMAQEYHHWAGYDPEHWLDVVPVCRIHHRRLDDIQRERNASTNAP